MDARLTSYTRGYNHGWEAGVRSFDGWGYILAGFATGAISAALVIWFGSIILVGV